MAASDNNARDPFSDVELEPAEVTEVQASCLVVAFDFLGFMGVRSFRDAAAASRRSCRLFA
jgi:hypothetical protein